MTIEAMKQALDALENHTAIKHPQQRHYRDSAIDTLRAAIEQAEKHKPHSLLCVCGAEWDIYPDGKEALAATAPRQWQGLTDEDLDIRVLWDILADMNNADGSIVVKFAKAIEAKLKEKNT